MGRFWSRAGSGAQGREGRQGKVRKRDCGNGGCVRKLLVVVDMQKDFVDGALGTKEARAVVQKVREKILKRSQEGWRIVFTMDTHGENYRATQEGRLLPVPHCVKGTDGWELAEGLCPPDILSGAKIYEKPAFGSEAYALDWARGAYADVDEVELVGLCTDICVLSNAILTKTFAPEIPVSVDAACCAGVTPESHARALEAMKMCQILVT